jgi:transcription elongation GreA/GreB family factor
MGPSFMDKGKLLNSLIEQLEEKLALLVHSAHEARQAATDDESKAENKYDTRGLEASYLAGAQAKRSEDLKQSILLLKRMRLREFSEQTPIDHTALVTTEIEAQESKVFFILPAAGGSKLQVDQHEVMVLTPESPIGQSLMGKRQGDLVDIPIKGKSVEYEILKVE